MRRQLAVLVTLAAAAAGLSGCADDSSSDDSGPGPSAGASPSVSPSATGSDGAGPTAGSSSPRPSGTSIDITIKGGKVSPNGDRVTVKVGVPVTLHIDADSPGEIHVHSTPEQEIEFEQGTSTKRLTITQPGIVDVEDHALEQVIVQLEAR